MSGVLKQPQGAQFSNRRRAEVNSSQLTAYSFQPRESKQHSAVGIQGRGQNMSLT